MQLITHFLQAVSKYPEQTAFVQPDGETISYAAAAHTVDIIAKWLLDNQLSTGAKIAIYSPNDAAGFIAMLGAIRAGFAWVSLNARNTIDDNIALAQMAEASVLFFHSQFAEHAERIRNDVPGIQLCACLDKASHLGPSLPELQINSNINVPSLIEDRDRPCTIFATGGTTGRSKGAVWTNQTWETLLANFWTCDLPPQCGHPVHLCVAPMTHGAGVLALMLLPKAPTNVLMASAEPAAILEAIEHYRVTHLFLPPTILYSLLSYAKLKEFDTSSLLFFLISAAPVSADRLREAIGVFGPVMCQAFGQAEAPFFLTYLSAADHQLAVRSESHAHLLNSCGRPTMFSEVEIMDETGNILPVGDTGEIVTRGNLVMAGYYQDMEMTEAVSKFGWHHTGDIGFNDDAGYVYIVDRKKDMIISGGFNIFSTEVEGALLGHQSILDCAVIGIPDDKWGEAVKAIVELKPGATATQEELINHCKAKLGSVKSPKSVEIWETLPRSPVGKVLKRSIKEQYWQGCQRSV